MPQYPPKDLNEGKVARYSYKEGIIPGEPEVIIISSNHVIKAELLQEGTFFLIHSFAKQTRFSNEKFGNRKN